MERIIHAERKQKQRVHNRIFLTPKEIRFRNPFVHPKKLISDGKISVYNNDQEVRLPIIHRRLKTIVEIEKRAINGVVNYMKREPHKFYSHENIKYTAKILGLSHGHIKQLKRTFDDIDVGTSGSIDKSEFFAALGEDETVLTHEIFKLVDNDDTHIIEFDDFVQVCATYCIYSQTDILKFCFDCFDRDSSGYIDEDEFRLLCQTIHNNNPVFPGNFSNALDTFDINGDGVIDVHEFHELHRRYPMLVYPAFRLQEKMQKITLGENTWVKIHEKIQKGRRSRDHIHYYSEIGRRKSMRDRLFPQISGSDEVHYLCPDRVDALKRGVLPRLV